MKVSESVEDSYDDHICEILEEDVYREASDSGEMAESNAYFESLPDMDYNLTFSGDLRKSVDE